MQFSLVIAVLSCNIFSQTAVKKKKEHFVRFFFHLNFFFFMKWVNYVLLSKGKLYLDGFFRV